MATGGFSGTGDWVKPGQCPHCGGWTLPGYSHSCPSNLFSSISRDESKPGQAGHSPESQAKRIARLRRALRQLQKAHEGTIAVLHLTAKQNMDLRLTIAELRAPSEAETP